jgi:hypothetical protein
VTGPQLRGGRPGHWVSSALLRLEGQEELEEQGQAVVVDMHRLPVWAALHSNYSLTQRWPQMLMEEEAGPGLRLSL